MTDDLVARLRDMCGQDGILKCRDIYDTDVAAAADRIEELQKQLAASDEEIRALRDEIENLEYEMCEMENRS
jgi:predicted  nucleic acid-binding Zn-ribbon protein